MKLTIKVEDGVRPTAFVRRLEIMNGEQYIATVYGNGPDTWIAARLFKAAPTLYRACQSALNALCGVPVDETQAQARDELRAALNEADNATD